jgi:chemotaxis signal transduction protein
MSELAPLRGSTDRILTFEVGDAVFALPIEAVLEVAEADRATCVPGIPANVAAVMNWNGDPLPLVASHLLLAGSDPEEPHTRPSAESTPVDEQTADEENQGVLLAQVLVISDRDDEAGRLGMPVDRVLGLVDGRPKAAHSQNLVVERRPVEGRVVSVLDPHRLVARAEEIIERTAP